MHTKLAIKDISPCVNGTHSKAVLVAVHTGRVAQVGVAEVAHHTLGTPAAAPRSPAARTGLEARTAAAAVPRSDTALPAVAAVAPGPRSTARAGTVPRVGAVVVGRLHHDSYPVVQVVEAGVVHPQQKSYQGGPLGRTSTQAVVAAAAHRPRRPRGARRTACAPAVVVGAAGRRRWLVPRGRRWVGVVGRCLLLHRLSLPSACAWLTARLLHASFFVQHPTLTYKYTHHTQ